MSALQKLKAYFGMVPADELDGYYADEDDPHAEYAHARRGYVSESYEEYEPRKRWFGGMRAGYRDEIHEDPQDYREEYQPVEPPRSRPAWTPSMSPSMGPSVSTDTQVRGALAMQARPESRPEPAVRVRSTPQPVAAPAAYPLGKIVTLHPASYIEARVIGEHYRDGNPVIMNLTEMEDAAARRLVDFAAGLAFAMRGSIDKVTNKVFLISPPNVDPTAEDKRRIAEGGFVTRA
jgi:cell division inhibitor SepF